MEPRFSSGDVIVRTEILDGREWMVYPLRVVADDSHLLAAYLAKGTPIAFGGGEFKWDSTPGFISTTPGSRTGCCNCSGPAMGIPCGPG